MGRDGAKASRNDDRCNFCGSLRSTVGHLISGPRRFICDQCVRESTALLPAGEVSGATVVYRPPPPRRPEGTDDITAPGGNPHCNFCSKQSREVKAIVEGYTTRICDECLDLCQDILNEKGQAQEDPA
jgi:ATP-dependent protease Clp ATPase subunit